MLYPMFVVQAGTVVGMAAIEPHQVLRARGMAVDFQHKLGAVAFFVSHEWCGRSHPDPHGEQFRILQSSLAMAISGKLRIEMDLISVVEFSLKSTVRARDFTGLADWYMWYDYFSAPQPDAKVADADQIEDVDMALSRAISSLSAYVDRCRWFVVLAPPLRHEDGRYLEFASWKSRGWCRFEWLSRVLSSAKDASALLIRGGNTAWQVAASQSITHAIGAGTFSKDADRQHLGPVVKRMLERKLQFLLDERCLQEYRHWLGLRAQLSEGLHIDWQSIKPAGHTSAGKLDAFQDVLQLFCYASPFEPRHFDALLLRVASLGDDVVIRALLQAMAAVDCKEDCNAPELFVYRGMQPVHFAAKHGHASALSLLLEHKADVNARTMHHDATPWFFAMLSGKREVYQTLLEHLADLCARAHLNLSALEVAAANDRLQAVRLLLEFGVSPAAGPNGHNALHTAASMGAGIEVQRALLAGRVNPCDRFRPTMVPWLIMRCCRLATCLGGRRPIMRLLSVFPGATPAVLAAALGHSSDVVRLLQEAQASTQAHGTDLSMHSASADAASRDESCAQPAPSRFGCDASDGLHGVACTSGS